MIPIALKLAGVRRCATVVVGMSAWTFCGPLASQTLPPAQEGARNLNRAIEDTEKQLRGGLALRHCAELMATNLPLARQQHANLLQTIRILEWVDKFLTTSRVGTASISGQHIKVAEDAFNLVLDNSTCALVGQLCPAWALGRTVGQLINEAHRSIDSSGRTLSDAIWDGAFEKYEQFTATSREDVDRAIGEARVRVRTIQQVLQAEQSCRKPNSMNAAAERLQRGERLVEPARAGQSQPNSNRPAPKQSRPDDCRIFDDPVEAMRFSESDPDGHQMLERRCL